MAKQNRFTKLLVCMTLVSATCVAVPVSSYAQAAVAAPKATKTPARATTAKKKPAYSATSARNRRANLAKARAAARARELREVQTPRFRVDEFGREVPDVRAEAAIIYNPVTGEVLWEDHAQDQRSIASITKVMTALVFLESGAALSTPVTVQKSDVLHASTTYLRTGFQLTADELLNLLLVGSDNAAARALARVSPFGSEGFIQKMNEKAHALGLDNTRYADPSGLLAENVSSAFDLARLISYASADERVTGIMRKSSYTTHIGKSHDQRQQHESAGQDRRHRRAGRQDRLHQPLRLLPGHACCGCRSRASRSRSSCSARRATPAVSGKPAICSTG